MERPIFQPMGTPQEELDTPSLVVDLAAAERNIARAHGAVQACGVQVRPHVSCHQCPHIARMQLAGPGPSGLAVNSLGEAEVFAAAGFDNLLITGRVVTPAKIRRLCALSATALALVAVDNPRNVQQLSEAAGAAGVSLGVLVDIDVGYGFGGAAPGPVARDLARSVAAVPGLDFRGIMAWDGPAALPESEPAQGEAEIRRRLQPLVDTRELLEREGLLPEIVSVGSDHNYHVAAGIAGVTEAQAGVYPLSDGAARQARPELEPAARVLASVISHPVAGRAVVDAGHKTTGPDFGLPLLEGVEGAAATRFSAEHGILELDGAATEQLLPNDKVWLVPYNLSLCFNQFDYVRAVRDGKLAGYWPIAARGRWD